MDELKQNYYGSLCTEMYEILHKQVPQDELDFYLSYAEKGKKILEPLCGSGRFFVPFLERGFDISGIDLSKEMLDKFKNEKIDFQTHLYRYGEMEEYLRECGFGNILTYATYQKETAVNDNCEMFIYECSI